MLLFICKRFFSFHLLMLSSYLILVSCDGTSVRTDAKSSDDTASSSPSISLSVDRVTQPIRIIRIETLNSSTVAWSEIEVFGSPSNIPQSSRLLSSRLLSSAFC